MDITLSTNVNKPNWQIVTIDNKEYLLKFIHKNNFWKILLTDFVYLYLEELSFDKLIDRCQKLNPALDIEDFDAKSHVSYLLNNIVEFASEIRLDCIQLSKVIEGAVFKFNIELKKGSALQLWEEVTMKLCNSIEVLVQKNKALIDIVKAKDEEILEYKAEGARLIRKNIETVKFDEKKFDETHSETNYCTEFFLNEIKNVMNMKKHLKSENKSISKEIKLECEKISEDGDLTFSSVKLESTSSIKTEKSPAKKCITVEISEERVAPKRHFKVFDHSDTEVNAERQSDNSESSSKKMR